MAGEIGRGQFENAVASERNRMQQQLGDQFSELAANENYMKTMRQQVLNRLIDESLLDQYARELGLSISDEQVKQAIFQTQAFQTNGKFDNQRFSGIVAQMGMTTDQYAQALRNQLTTQQLINAIAGTDFMLPGESDQLAALVSQQRVVREATINVNAPGGKNRPPAMRKSTPSGSRIRPVLWRRSSSASATSKWMPPACRRAPLTTRFSHGTTSTRISSLSRSATATA